MIKADNHTWLNLKTEPRHHHHKLIMALQHSPTGSRLPRNDFLDDSTNNGQQQAIIGDAPPGQVQATNTEYVSLVTKPQLPTFMKDRPDIWFFLIESEFTASRIRSDDVKYNATLRALDADTLQQITDIISAPPIVDKYGTLKEVIIKRTAESRQKQMHRLLNDLVLGDKKPSQLLREMKDLAANSINDEMLHNLWVSRLPPSIRPLLLISEFLNLTALAEMADRLMETVTLNSNINAIAQPVAAMSHATHPRIQPVNSTTELQLREIQNAISFIIKELDEVKKLQIQQSQKPQYQHQSRPRSQNRDRPRSPSSEGGVCFYHRQYGHDARRCLLPCSYKPSDNNQGN